MKCSFLNRGRIVELFFLLADEEGWSQRECARQLGFSQFTICQVRSGKARASDNLIAQMLLALYQFKVISELPIGSSKS